MGLVYRQIIKITNLKTIVLFFILFVLAMLMVNIVFKSGINYLTQTFNYTPEEAYQIINDYGESGRNLHIRILSIDIILVILYTVLFSTATAYTAKKLFPANELLPRLSLLSVVLGSIQIIEIIGLFVVFINYPSQLFGLVKVINVITVSKYILTVICILLPIIGFVSLLIKRMYLTIKSV